MKEPTLLKKTVFCVLINVKRWKMNVEIVLKFCQLNIVRFLFLMTDEALTTLAKEVPWFHEWKTADGLLDFNDDVNKQLCTLFKLRRPNLPTSPTPSALSTIPATRINQIRKCKDID